MKKKIVAIVLAGCMALGLIACGTGNTQQEDVTSDGLVDNRLIDKPQKLVPYEDVQLSQEGDSSALSVQGELYKTFLNAVAEYDAAYLTIDFNDKDGQLYYQLEQHYYDEETTQSYWYEFVNYSNDEIMNGIFFDGGFTFPIIKSMHRPDDLTTVSIDIGIYDKGFLFTEKLVLWYQDGILMIEERKGIPELVDLHQEIAEQENAEQENESDITEGIIIDPYSPTLSNDEADIYMGKTYMREDNNITITLQTPDENGYPTEMVVNGISGIVNFDNETIRLSEVHVSKADGFSIYTPIIINGQEKSLSMHIKDGKTQVYTPELLTGNYVQNDGAGGQGSTNETITNDNAEEVDHSQHVTEAQEFMNVTFTYDEDNVTHTIVLTKLDDVGNLIEFEYDGYPVKLANVTREYYDADGCHTVEFAGTHPGFGVQFEYVFSDDTSDYGESRRGCLHINTSWYEGNDPNCPYIEDGDYYK